MAILNHQVPCSASSSGCADTQIVSLIQSFSQFCNVHLPTTHVTTFSHLNALQPIRYIREMVIGQDNLMHYIIFIEWSNVFWIILLFVPSVDKQRMEPCRRQSPDIFWQLLHQNHQNYPLKNVIMFISYQILKSL